MLIFQIIVLMLVLLIAFWQASLIYAQILGAPSVNSSQRAISEAFKLAGLKKGEIVVDLGSGSGLALIIAASKFGAKGVGVERSPFYYLLSKIKVFLSGCSKDVKIYFGDFRRVEKQVQKADVVYLYLLNSVLENIESWIFGIIGDKTRIVSLAFYFPNKKPISTTTTLNLGRKTIISLYKK